MDSVQTVLERLNAGFDSLTPTERKVARRLLGDSPMDGLKTIAQLASEAGVSGPTVLRLVAKLGFDSYAGFQAALREELGQRLQSPLARQKPVQPGKTPPDFLGSFLLSAQLQLEQTARQLPVADLEACVAMLSDPGRRVALAGGRLSAPLAAYLAQHLKAMRPGVCLLDGGTDSWADALVDMGRHDVLLLLDIRRYNSELMALAQRAASHKLDLILLTDQWLSPISQLARVTLVGVAGGASGWDSNLSLFLLLDALIAAIMQRQTPACLARLAALEGWRTAG
ncbi:MurR/RpiR family transcriptional regulator [Craterilacuibacter sinensis]|uniref:SIS domain-containing protein n=1 Tax=Craterilacuibacter sinensis TaxID=2686017 RepID=A0A845BJW3_9NEIS|nr:MurR/RpiR family transcriptional regulator [Craterilacuibacter sinensis]MXR36997.1 SIS domain-containing protein [Craterilacuibacter sinensis]